MSNKDINTVAKREAVLADRVSMLRNGTLTGLVDDETYEKCQREVQKFVSLHGCARLNLLSDEEVEEFMKKHNDEYRRVFDLVDMEFRFIFRWANLWKSQEKKK